MGQSGRPNSGLSQELPVASVPKRIPFETAEAIPLAVPNREGWRRVIAVDTFFEDRPIVEVVMPSTVSVRLLQVSLGAAYVFVALVALAKAPGLVTLLVAASAMLVSYLTSRTVPDAFVSPDVALRICAVGLAIICVGAVADAIGSPQILEWVAIVMAYCAGNRLRAAGIGPAR